MPPADYVLVEVADTGTGIPPEIIDKIFEPFFSTKEVGKGTGLGLSTVYGIVKQTNGYVFVDSEVGEGHERSASSCRAMCRTPRRSHRSGAGRSPGPARRQSRWPISPATAPSCWSRTRKGLRALNARGLTSRGYTVLEAGNGVEAIEMIESRGGDVDLVVSDVVMPEMDGPTLAKELRTRNPGLKIIFVSGYAEDAFEKNLPEGGQFDFLAKPFTLKQLVAAVKETMVRSAQLQSDRNAGTLTASTCRATARKIPQCQERVSTIGVTRSPPVWATQNTGKDGPTDSQGAT